MPRKPRMCSSTGMYHINNRGINKVNLILKSPSLNYQPFCRFELVGVFSPPHITRTHLRGANRKVFENIF